MASDYPSPEREIVDGIRAQYMGLRDLPRKSLASSIKTLADDLYAKDTHFIFELIQNAEDNAYADGVRPTLRFRLCEGAVGAESRLCLVVENNETGFEKAHATALCQVGQSTKTKEQGYIGEKGIGFKSVFRVTDRPAVHSNGFHFELPESDAETGLGYIVPAWDETTSVVGTPLETTIVLPLKAGIAPETITTALQDIAPETILFLSKLKTIEIEVALPDVCYEILIEKDDSRAPLVELTHRKRQQGEEELRTRRYWVADREFDKPPHIHDKKRPNVNARTVSVAIPLDDGREHPGKLFAYLPVWERTGLPFLVNADFLLVSSREGIPEEAPWNRWLRDCIAPVYADAFMAIVGNESWPIEQRAQAYASIPTASRQEWLEPVVGEIQRHLGQEACVLTNPNGALAKPEFCRLPSDAWRELLETPGHPPAALGKDFAFTHSAIAGTFADVLRQIGVSDLQAEDILACLRDTAWLEARTDEWFFRLFRELSCLEADTLQEVKIIPAVVLGERNREVLACTDHPVYFRPDKDGAKALRAIPAWLRKAKPVAFLPKPLQRLIDECDDHKKLRKWITEQLGVYPFTAGNYCVDVLDYLQDEKDRIGKKRLVEATKFLVEHALKNFKWSQLPIVLADGSIMTVAEAWTLTWNDGDPVQALVVPESYDPETGWQHIWRTDEDRQHFRYLSACYPRDVADGLTKRGVIDSAPGFRRGQLRHKPRLVSKVVITRFAPSTLTEPDCRVSGALVRWLGSKPGKRSIRWPGDNKRPFNGPCEPDYQWALNLTYYTQGNSLYHVQTGYYKFCCEHSEIVQRLRRTAWLPTTKGLVRPFLAFLPKRETREVLGNTVPYFEGDLPEALLALLGVNVSVTVETLLNRLDACRDDPAMDAKLPERIYRQLSSRTQNGDDSGLRGEFRDRPLVFLPDRPAGRQWVSSKDCVWRDACELFGEAFGYLEKAYPRLMDFFVGSLGVKETVDAESYVRRWLQLQDEPPAEGQTRRPVVAKLYAQLRQALKMEPQPDWLRDFLRKAQVYTQSDTFEDPACVVVPDDGNLKRLFDGEAAFAWRPDHDAFADWQPLYEALEVRRLSECVHTQLDSPPRSVHVPEERLLTPACVQMIASWLREKEREAYNQLLEDGVFKRLFDAREEQAETSLRVVYTLAGIGDAYVVKSEELPVFWDSENFRLVLGPLKEAGGEKQEAAAQLVRFLLASKRDEHGLAEWLENVFAAPDISRLKRKNWSVPREILDLSREQTSPDGAEDSDTQIQAAGAPSPSVPGPLGIPFTPRSAAAPQSEPAPPVGRPVSPAPVERQSDSPGYQGAMSSTEPDQNVGSSSVEPSGDAPQPPESATADYAEMLSEAFERPGETAIDEDVRAEYDTDGNSVRNPQRRARKLAEQHREKVANEPTPDERRRTTERTLLEPADPQVRQKLLDWYGGRCQICGETWPERDGTPFFVTARLVERRHAQWLDDPGNAVCLCAEHFAQWRHAAKEAPVGIAEQAKALVLPSQGGTEKLSIQFTMLGTDVEVVYCEKHFLAMKVLLGSSENVDSGT